MKLNTTLPDDEAAALALLLGRITLDDMVRLGLSASRCELALPAAVKLRQALEMPPGSDEQQESKRRAAEPSISLPAAIEIIKCSIELVTDPKASADSEKVFNTILSAMRSAINDGQERGND